MKVVVTGGAGAIGGNLVRALLARGDEVLVLDDLSSGHAEAVPEGATLQVGSVDDPAAVAEAFAGGPDVVFHLAALFANQNSVEHPRADLLANGLGTLTVLEACVGAAVTKVLVCSSSCVYGPGPFDDELPVALPTETPYAMTKALSEGYASFFAAEHGLDTVVVRPFNVYGPGEHPGPYRNVVPNFFATALAGEPLVVTGTGDETRDFTFVDDAVRAMLAFVAAPTRPGEALNIATGIETRIGDLAERVNRLTGNAGGVVLRGRRSWDDVSRRCGTVELARRRTGFAAQVALDDGLAATLDWLRSVDG